MTSGRPSLLRDHVALRGVLVGLVCGVGAVVAHGVSTAGDVGAGTGTVVALAGLAAGPLLALRPSLPRVVVVSVLLQLGAHASMALTGMGTGMGTDMSTGMADGHVASHSSTVSSVLAMVLHGGAPMLLGHLAAAVLTALLARGADRALTALLGDWLRALVVPLAVVPRRPLGPSRTVWPLRLPPRRVAATCTAGPRAPPCRRRTSPILA